MKKIFSRLLLSLVFLALLAGGYHFFESSTYPKTDSHSSGEAEVHTPVKLPDSLYFAGERVPLEYFDVRESLDRELLVNSYFHSQTIRFLKMAPRFFAIIEPVLLADSIPADFKYLALAESGFDPRAVSPAGAVGFWQFMKGTATDYGLEVGSEVDERYHIERSTLAACRYLKDSYKKYGSWTLVAASYNAGRSFVDRQIGRQGEASYYDLLLGEETSRYVFRIMALKLILENPEAFDFKVRDDEKYPLWDTRTIDINSPVKDFAEFAREHGTNYKILKMLNPWLRETYLTNARGRTYTIKLPAEGFRTKTN
ncbi:lytic transglycosylase domain-containing protein [Gaoshiqia sp. Z1-71]|uniref:lytic transglycosylase domain-containing protein n=1 Tax=Gaoshiqia hydrogeniformans TaxID=3290090 RepID=UPI003BF830C2